MSLSSFLVLFALVTVCRWLPLFCAAQDVDRAALIAFYTGSNGPTTWNVSSRWEIGNASSRPCRWSGVECDGNDRVVAIKLERVGLTGTLSQSLGSLLMLQNLDLQHNQLGGTLPLELSQCTRLEELHLQDNDFVGSLPGEFSAWTSLSIFHVYQNRLNGTLPRDYQSFTQMASFEVDQNELSGSLPSEYSAWRGIKSFLVQRNTALAGTLPPSYGLSWKTVKDVYIFATAVSGPIPEEWGGMSSLYGLQLFNNKLNGTIPASLGNLSKLFYINLSFNNFSGDVPWEAWSALRGVKVIGLQDNPHLTGTVPLGFSNSLIFLSSALSLCRTNICGPQLPALILGYGCVPAEFVKNIVVLDDATMQQMVMSGTYENAIPCSTPQPPEVIIRNVTKTRFPVNDDMVVVQPEPQLRKAVALLTPSFVVISQLMSSASTGGLHAMQAAMTIQRLRRLCLAAQNASAPSSSLSSSGDDQSTPASCCDISTSPLQLTLDVNGSGGAGEAEFGALVGNTVLVVSLGLLRLLGRQVREHCRRRSKMMVAFTAVERGAAPNTLLHPVIDALVNMCFSARHIAVLWPAYTLLLCPTVGVVCVLLQLADASSSLLVAVALSVCWGLPWCAANCALYCNAHLRNATTSFDLCSSSSTDEATSKGESGGNLNRFKVSWSCLRLLLLRPADALQFPSHEVAEAVEQDYGPVVFGFRSSRLWYFNVELLFAVANGVLIGMALSLDPCRVDVIGWVLVGLALLECLAALCIRPYCAMIDVIVLVVVNGLSVIAQVLSLVDDSDASQSASAMLGLVASSLQCLVSILLAVEILSAGGGYTNVYVRFGGGGSRKHNVATETIANSSVTSQLQQQQRRSTPIGGGIEQQQQRSLSKASVAIEGRTVAQQHALYVLVFSICNVKSEAVNTEQPHHVTSAKRNL
jgi:hypothetical protein